MINNISLEEGQTITTVRSEWSRERSSTGTDTAVALVKDLAPWTLSSKVAAMLLDGQRIMASLFDLSLCGMGMSNVSEKYGIYQKRLLRQRAKPAIASLVKSRHNQTGGEERQLYVNATTAILSEASSLIEPLEKWRITLERELPIWRMCTVAIDQINQEAMKLACRVGDWFSNDVINNWLDIVKSYHQKDATYEMPTKITGLNEIVNQLAFICQVISRYDQFYSRISEASKEPSSLKLFLTELSGQYAILEDYLLSCSFRNAVNMASRVEIFDNVFVPSIVEDSFYLSRQCVERSYSTMNAQAILTVLNRVVEIWGEHSKEGVYHALLQKDIFQPSHVNRLSEVNNDANSKTDKENFTSAFLEALDDDIGPQPSLERKLKGIQIRSTSNDMDFEICLLNGIASASSACIALSDMLQTILEEVCNDEVLSKMLQFAKEELHLHSRSYKDLLTNQSQILVGQACFFFASTRKIMEAQIYSLNSNDFSKLKENQDPELTLASLIGDDELLDVIKGEKCDFIVVLELMQIISAELATILHESILQPPKQFTDWGSMLFSKQVRLFQDSFCDCVHAIDYKQDGKGRAMQVILNEFRKIDMVVTILQLEKPTDWSTLKYSGEGLEKTEVQAIMKLRIDFTDEAVKAACG